MVYPTYPDTFWSFKHIMRFVSRKAAFPPLGLLTVAAMLPEKWDKRLIDTNVHNLEDSDIEWADMVMVSAMIVQKQSAQSIIDRCKAKGKKVVAGGPVFTTQHENFSGVDHFILNEAESTLPEFLKDLEDGNPKQVYSSSERPDVSNTPIPMWSLINPQDYGAMAVQYSRGCPFNCEFCDIVIMNGRVPRTKAPQQVIAEFQALYESGWRGALFVVDDNFIGNKLKAKELLPAIIAWQKEHNYPFTLLTEASTNLADDKELMGLMASANFSKVFLGIETPKVESLEECGKMQNARRNLVDTVKIIQRNGMQVFGGFIVGFDHDDDSIFDAQIEFIQNVGCVVAMVGILNALPQTRLWKRLKTEGRLLKDTTGNNTDVSINFTPTMGTQTLLDGYKRIISTIYSPQKYYERVRIFLRNYRPVVKGNFCRNDVHAFLLSMWEIGVLSRLRFKYWRLLLSTAFRNWKAFPTAVELAIYGEHFMKVAGTK